MGVMPRVSNTISQSAGVIGDNISDGGGKRIYAGASVLIVYIGDIFFVLPSVTSLGVHSVTGCMLENIDYGRVQMFVFDRRISAKINVKF